MNDVEAQYYLRQQLNRARILLAKLETEMDTAQDESAVLPLQRALTQSCVSCLDLGFSHYLATVFEVARPHHLLDYASMPLPTIHSKQAEIKALLVDGKWLYDVSTLSESLHFTLSSWAQHRLNSHATVISTVEDGNLIASNRSNALVLHWSQVKPTELDFLLRSAEELLERYAEADIEY